MQKLYLNNKFLQCVSAITAFVITGSVDQLWEGIRHGFEAVVNAKT